MRTLLELVRIFIILFIVIGVSSYFFNTIYLEMGINIEEYGLFVFSASFILFFVLYRNKLQFSGWYKGKGRDKLPRKVSQILIFSSIVLLLFPPVLNWILR